MSPYQQKYLPYAIFFSTILVGTVTLLTATQLRKPTDEKSIAPEASQAGTNGSIYTPDSVACSNDSYKLKLKVDASGNPNYSVFSTPGASNTHNTKEYTTSYTLSIDSYEAKYKGEWYTVPRTQCILADYDGRVVYLKEGDLKLAIQNPESTGDLAKDKKVTIDGKEYTITELSLNDIKTSRKCSSLEESSDLLKSKKVQNRYNGVKLLWEDYRNLCEGQAGQTYYSGESCPDGKKACCWNTDTSNHQIKHDRVWLQVHEGDSLGDKEKITSSYTTQFARTADGKYCGTIQHDTLVPAFLPHDGGSDVDCNGSKNGSLPAFYGLSQTGYSCSQTENRSPVCERIQKSPEGGATANPDGSYPANTKWTMVCTGSDADTSDRITGFEYQILDATNNSVKQTIRCLDASAQPSPQVGSATCTYNGNIGSLQRYAFPNQGDFKAKCRVRDSKGAWSVQ